MFPVKDYLGCSYGILKDFGGFCLSGLKRIVKSSQENECGYCLEKREKDEGENSTPSLDKPL